MARKKKNENGTMLGSHEVSASKPKFKKIKEKYTEDIEGLIASDEGLKKAYEKDQAYGEYAEKSIRHIWEGFETDKIFLFHARVGAEYTKMFPIYDQSHMVDLLINYGYRIDVILMFLDEFARSSWKSDGSPRILMTDSYKLDIYENVEKLSDIPVFEGEIVDE